MKQEAFDEIMHRRMKVCEDVLRQKSSEYSTDEDKLHNFKRAAGMLRCSPERALVGMMAKHVISVLDIVDAFNEDRGFSSSVFDEKITDTINYLILLEALIKERCGQCPE